MKDYSQTGEQAHVLKVLEGIPRGRVLDIGAWSAEDKSNTRALIEMGWEGVLIEPSPGPLKGLVQAYAGSGVIVLSTAVTVEGGIIYLAVTDDAVSQDPKNERFETWKQCGFYGCMAVNSIALRDLFAHYGGDFEMVNIDVEGTSVDLFAEMCRIGPRPKCVVVEHDARHVELAGIAEAANYRQVHLNGNNVVLSWEGVRER